MEIILISKLLMILLKGEKMRYLTLVLLTLITFNFSAYAEGRDGKTVYTAHCTTCHSIGVANAPKTHDEAAWEAKGKTVDQFLESAIKGLNAMPPKGACGDCTDDELKAAIEFMIKKNEE
ncbi:MAG: c-type cytochrome [Bdellovibrionota bacterium]